jgi:twinkle protein
MHFDQLTKLGIKLTKRSGQTKTLCPKCSHTRKKKSEPCLSVNVDIGTYKCFNPDCDWSRGGSVSKTKKDLLKNYFKPSKDMLKDIQREENMKKYFTESRGISEKTLEKFFIHSKKEWMPGSEKEMNCIVFPYLRDGEIVNAKYRDGKKGFKLVKNAELIFFGMQTLGDRRCAIIVEGEIDALSAYEAGFGQDYEPVCNEDGEIVEHELGRFAVLSVPNGASTGNQKLDYLDNCAEYFNNIEEFVIATDNDDPGKSLQEELIRRLGAERCRKVDWSIIKSHQTNGNGPKIAPKDLNEVLCNFGKEALKSLILNSQEIQISGIFYIKDIFPKMLENFENGIELGDSTRFGIMDDYFRWKRGDVNLCTGYANAGKSTFMLQLMLTKSIWDGWKWAVFSPENYPAYDFYDDLVEMYAGKWKSNMTKEEYSSACKFIGEHIYFVYPEYDHDLDSVHEKFRHLILKKGIDGVMIDPFNQLDSMQKSFQREDQYLSNIIKDIKRFALINGICYNIVAHPKSPNYKEDRSLPVADMYDLAGGAMWGNKMDNIISYYRPRFHQDKNSNEVEIWIQKLKRRRTGGKLGHFDLVLDWKTKRFVSPDTGRAFCDPAAATRAKSSHNPDNITQPEISNQWLPYRDDTGTEAPF